MNKEIERLQRQLETLEKADQAIHMRVEELERKAENSAYSRAVENKLNNLTEVNEQMFQQNLRLRQFIEECIEVRTIPTSTMYYDVLRDDN